MPLSYNCFVFDCDGVILNSNKIKTNAFFDTALPYGKEPAQQLKEYHIKNGGISRFIKFEYFFSKILKIDFNKNNIDLISKDYGDKVFNELIKCEVSHNLSKLRDLFPEVDWVVASGSFQEELREVFHLKSIAKYFNKGIYGSPCSKEEILLRELKEKNITLPGLFIGDSVYDFMAAKMVGFDFVFMYKWTELDDWKSFCDQEKIKTVRDFDELIDYLEQNSYETM